MDSRFEIIQLIGDDFSIDVKKDNPVFKTLSKFIGDTVIVFGKKIKEEQVPDTPKQQLPPVKLKQVTLSREEVWEKFNNDFTHWNLLEEKEKPVVFVLLKNHVSSFLEGDTGDLLLNEYEENTFKRGNSYLIYEPHK